MALFSRKEKEEKAEALKQVAAKPEQKASAKKAASSAKASEKKSEKKEVVSGKPVASEQAMAHRVLRRALITEKGTNLSKENTVLFEVLPTASKLQIKQAVFEAYGVRPVSVRTMNMSGKRVRFGRTLGSRRDWKKAMVTLPEGQSIAIHDAV